MTAPVEVAVPARRPARAAKEQAGVLFDVPGPRARLRNNILTLVFAAGLLVVLYLLFARLSAKGQFEGALWSPFVKPDTWTDFIIPGLVGTLKATVLAAVFSLVSGVLFGLGRLSEHWWIRVPSGAAVEFFRGIPLLLLIFFVFSGPATIAGALDREVPQISALTAVVVGLTLYNGSVLAEIFRAGILAVPKGQSEAAYSIGLRKGGVMRLVLVPQATTAMMPAIVSQLVVLLKDSALGWIISYEDLLNSGFRFIPTKFHNLLPAAIVIALIYIAINLMLGFLANWLERRSRRVGRTAVPALDP